MAGPVLKLREGALAWVSADEETVLLDLDRSSYLGVNRSGSLLWPMLADGTTRDEMIERMCQTFSIEHDRAADDVDRFVAQCAERGYFG